MSTRKKVPVLIHNDNPFVNLQLLCSIWMDEVWKNKAPTMPYHPYERAQARFWADYIHNNIPNFFGSFALIFTQFWWLLFKTLRLMFMLYLIILMLAIDH